MNNELRKIASSGFQVWAKGQRYSLKKEKEDSNYTYEEYDTEFSWQGWSACISFLEDYLRQEGEKEAERARSYYMGQLEKIQSGNVQVFASQMQIASELIQIKKQIDQIVNKIGVSE